MNLPQAGTFDGGGLIWPYRFDLLVRIDFLEWLETVGKHLLSGTGMILTGRDVLASGEFFAMAKQHPYFPQYTRFKARFRGCDMTWKEAENIYADGIASFLSLHEDIKRRPELKQRIILKKPFLVGWRVSAGYFIGDGCHRFACLAWGRKSFDIPTDCFEVRHLFALKPVDQTTAYRQLGILSDDDVDQFRHAFEKSGQAEWNSVLKWVKAIRDRWVEKDPRLWFEQPVSTM
ncbi:MAG: hypothetical protein PHR77_03695 [Kiritimatiellae bacterium]|nr:hypothetical protein [Kiritimatiellia bacterium]MDD5522681.1 hypothetical protein [Kiritimatiellia bacterium]